MACLMKYFDLLSKARANQQPLDIYRAYYHNMRNVIKAAEPEIMNSLFFLSAATSKF